MPIWSCWSPFCQTTMRWRWLFWLPCLAGQPKQDTTGHLSFQRERDYVLASKTSGSSNLKIMFREVLLNTLNDHWRRLERFATLGLKPGCPSLVMACRQRRHLWGLWSVANDPVQHHRPPWPGCPLRSLLTICLSINYVGQALQKVGDARQREN